MAGAIKRERGRVEGTKERKVTGIVGKYVVSSVALLTGIVLVFSLDAILEIEEGFQ